MATQQPEVEYARMWPREIFDIKAKNSNNCLLRHSNFCNKKVFTSFTEMSIPIM
jgi:hypothetical protein